MNLIKSSPKKQKNQECKNIVHFLQSKDDKQGTWLQSVGKSKDKEAKKAYRQRRKCFSTKDGFCSKKKNGATIVNR